MTEAETKSRDGEARKKPNRMDRRRLETRAKLMAATLQLVLERGVDKTTMDAITETADLGRRTFYYHFASKEACILAAAGAAYERHAAMAEESLSDDNDPAMVVAQHAHAGLAGLLGEPVTVPLAGHPKLLAEALDASVGKFALQDFHTGIDQGRFHLTMREDLLSGILVWAIVGLLIEGVEQGAKLRDLQHAYAILVLTTLGVPAEEAEKISKQAGKRFRTRSRRSGRRVTG